MHRIVAIGTSMVHGIGPTEADGGSLSGARPYPILLERRLRQQGVEVTTVVSARLRRLLRHTIRRFEDDVWAHAPDVVICHFGAFEPFSGAVPQVVRRYLWFDTPSQASPARWVRRTLVPAARRVVRRTQRIHGRLRGERAGRVGPDRFERELRLLLDSVSRLCGDPLVVLVGITPFGSVVERAMPGVNERIARLDAVVARVAADHPENVVYLDLAAALDGIEWRGRDGFHLTPEGHSATAEALVPIIGAHLAARQDLDGGEPHLV